MTNKEIESYRANFEYGRQCWAEFVKEHPVDKPFTGHPQRKVVEDPEKEAFDNMIRVKTKEMAKTPAPEPVQPQPQPVVPAKTNSSVITVIITICAFLFFILLLG